MTSTVIEYYSDILQYRRTGIGTIIIILLIIIVMIVIRASEL